MMQISNQDLVFKLKSIGVRVEGDDAHIDTDIVRARSSRIRERSSCATSRQRQPPSPTRPGAGLRPLPRSPLAVRRRIRCARTGRGR
jgi:hypothetical protein